MRTGGNLDFLQSVVKQDTRLGYTTTVREQVDDIQISMQHFKKTLEGQRKTQGQIQLQIKKLEEQTKTQFNELNKEISERINYLSECFKADLNNQNKQFQYMEMQNRALHDQHDKLQDLSAGILGRADDVENNVGM